MTEFGYASATDVVGRITCQTRRPDDVLAVVGACQAHPGWTWEVTRRTLTCYLADDVPVQAYPRAVSCAPKA